MNFFEMRSGQLHLATQGKLALLLIASLLLWTIGAPTLFNRVNASNLTSISDTLTQSGPSQLAGHTIQFTSSAAIAPSQTIVIQLDPSGSAFTEAYSAATSTDFTFFAGGAYTVVSACTSGNQVSAVGNYNNGSNENLTLTVCPSAAQIATSTAVTIGIATSTSATKVWTNPAATGSYEINIAGTQTNSGTTQVAVVNNVTLTASVNTSFTFTVSGVATGTQIGAGDFTTGSTTATALPFGTLSSAPTASSSLAQQLTVSTNATNGFSVTVQENQPPTSATGQLIYLFNNGASSTQPLSWQTPSSTIGVYSTYGHLGFTSDDTDLSGSNNAFSNATKWAGDLYQPHVIFANSGPADGTTQNVGKARVDYKIQIGALQPAGNDYTNTLWYVATPTF